jgi:hypothetical protein
MVILRGIVRSGRDSTESEDVYLASAMVVQVSSAVYTSSNGTFYTSAINLDTVTCIAEEHQIVTYSIPDFATTYDPAGVISGSATLVDTSSYTDFVRLWDTSKVFVPGTLAGRLLEMRSGIDDGKTAYVKSNDANSVLLGGASGFITSGWSY